MSILKLKINTLKMYFDFNFVFLLTKVFKDLFLNIVKKSVTNIFVFWKEFYCGS